MNHPKYIAQKYLLSKIAMEKRIKIEFEADTVHAV